MCRSIDYLIWPFSALVQTETFQCHEDPPLHPPRLRLCFVFSCRLRWSVQAADTIKLWEKATCRYLPCSLQAALIRKQLTVDHPSRCKGRYSTQIVGDADNADGAVVRFCGWALLFLVPVILQCRYRGWVLERTWPRLLRPHATAGTMHKLMNHEHIVWLSLSDLPVPCLQTLWGDLVMLLGRMVWLFWRRVYSLCSPKQFNTLDV